jgi:hypothetical protein
MVPPAQCVKIETLYWIERKQFPKQATLGRILNCRYLFRRAPQDNLPLFVAGPVLVDMGYEVEE